MSHEGNCQDAGKLNTCYAAEVAARNTSKLVHRAPRIEYQIQSLKGGDNKLSSYLYTHRQLPALSDAAWETISYADAMCICRWQNIAAITDNAWSNFAYTNGEDFDEHDTVLGFITQAQGKPTLYIRAVVLADQEIVTE